VSKKLQWEIEAEKKNALRSQAIKSLTSDQVKALDQTYVALSEFVSEYSEMFDITSENARKLQYAYWQLRHEFNRGGDND
tara:strand:+ start:62 stop:301 length:240 start_codon:yes stop_codon:yes gene_type:complete